MPPDTSADVKFEIGHVLFIDIVGYSKLNITEQSERLQKLKEIVWATEQFKQAQAESKLLRLPTGDGGALVFRNNVEAPVLCAMAIGKELKRHPEIHVRMGIHSGPVNEITDLNAQATSPAPELTLPSGSWTAVTPGTFCCHNMSLTTLSTIRVGNPTCTR